MSKVHAVEQNKVRLEEELSDSLPQTSGTASTKETLAVAGCEGPVLETFTTVRTVGCEDPESKDSTSTTVLCVLAGDSTGGGGGSP